MLITGTMPRIAAVDYLSGYVHARIDQLHVIIRRVEPSKVYTADEAKRMREEVRLIEREVTSHARFVDDPSVNPKMSEYYAIYRLADLRLGELELKVGLPQVNEPQSIAEHQAAELSKAMKKKKTNAAFKLY